MGILKSIAKVTPAYWIGDKLDVLGVNAQRRADEYSANEAAQRAGAKNTQYQLLGQMKGPQVTPQQEARIKALEDESKLGLEVDPNFQSQLRQARVGGAQSLASIQNAQAATGAGGGFSNVGSMSDVYDRLGVQLADLAGKQQQYREAKRDKAADIRQSIADAEVEYQNAVTSAKMAIESGDAQASQQALARAYAAREQIQARTQQLFLGAAQIGVGAMTGNPMAAAGGAQTIQNANQQTPSVGAGMSGGDTYATSNSLQYDFDRMRNQPYYTQRAR